MTTQEPFGIDRVISAKEIKVTIRNYSKTDTLQGSFVVDQLLENRDGNYNLKKMSRWQYSRKMVSIHMQFILLISFVASLYIFFNCIPYFLLKLCVLAAETTDSRWTQTAWTNPIFWIVVTMVFWLCLYVFINVYVYIGDSWLLPLYFHGILGDKLLWYNKDLENSMIAMHCEMVDDKEFTINNISAIRGINGAQNNIGNRNQFKPQLAQKVNSSQKLELVSDASDEVSDSDDSKDDTDNKDNEDDKDDKDDKDNTDIKNTTEDIEDNKYDTEQEDENKNGQDAVVAVTRELAVAIVKDVDSKEQDGKKKKCIDKCFVCCRKTVSSEEKEEKQAKEEKNKNKNKKKNKNLAINTTFDSNETFAALMDGWNVYSVLCSFGAYWIVLIIWLVFYIASVMDVFEKYSDKDSDWDYDRFEDEYNDALDDGTEQVTNAKHYQFWVLGLCMTPVWFFICVIIFMLIAFTIEAQKYKRIGNKDKDKDKTTNANENKNINGVSNSGVTARYDDKDGNVCEMSLSKKFNFEDIVNDFVSSKDGLAMVVLVHLLLLFTWLVWHWMSSVAVKITSEDNASLGDVNVESERNNPLLSYWALLIFTTIMQKICEYFAGRYDKWKLGDKEDDDHDVDDNNNDNNNDTSNKYIDVGLEFTQLVSVFMVILYSFGFRFLFTNVDQWASFLGMSIFHCVVNIANGSIQSYMKFHDKFNCIKAPINSFINKCVRNCNNNNDKQWFELIENEEDLTQFNKDLAFGLCYNFVISISSCLIVISYFGITSWAVDSEIDNVVYLFISVSLLFDCIVFFFQVYFFNEKYNDFFTILLIEYDANNQLYWRTQLRDTINVTKRKLADTVIKLVKEVLGDDVKLSDEHEQELRERFEEESIHDQVFLYYASKSLINKICQVEKQNKFLDNKGDKKIKYYGYGRLLFVELILSWLWIGSITGTPTDAS